MEKGTNSKPYLVKSTSWDKKRRKGLTVAAARSALAILGGKTKND